MNLSHLTDNALLADTVKLVKKERKIVHLILFHLKEIEFRRLYLLHNHSSLFAYCVKELQYTEQEALMRIKAMRLLKDSPAIEKKLIDGDINLTQASQIQAHLQKNDPERKSSPRCKEVNLNFI